jgi:hypothetical protein
MSTSPQKEITVSRDYRRRTGELTVRQQKYMQGLAEGKSIMQAAMDAGYAESTARRGMAGIAKENVAKAEIFRGVLQSVFTPGEFAQKILAGCESTEVRLVPTGSTKIRKIGPNGELMEREQHEAPKEIHLVSWSNRLRYMELWARMSGLLTDGDGITGKTQLAQIQHLYDAGPVERVKEE